MIDYSIIYNFIDLDFVRIYNIKIYSMPHLAKILMRDSKKSWDRLIMQEVELLLSIKLYYNIIQFYTIKLRGYSIILSIS
jgi:hypothetical protein